MISAHDIYQLVVGEIGIDRRVYLYDMQYWEILRVISGYRRRDIPKLQMLRLVAYFAKYAMRSNDNGETPAELVPMSFDDEDEELEIYTEEEQDELIQEMILFKKKKQDGDSI